MNDGMFMALRAELQEANSLSRQILSELQRTNELLAARPLEQVVNFIEAVTESGASKTTASKPKAISKAKK